ncbi:MAG: hypothetical protein PHN36_04125 [Patescibacteria group bacterium]|nr:hypothetical protein [Patescibacteria group bacterium]
MNVAVFVSLYFILGRNHATALAATDHAGIREGMRFRFGLAPMSEHFLNPVIFVARDHGFVFAFVPVATAFWPLKPAVIKGIIKQAVVAATRQVFQSPFFNRDFVHPGSGEVAA